MNTPALIAFALLASGALAQTRDDPTKTVIALEREVLDGWQKGTSERAVALLDADVSYFHIFTEKRLDGRAAVAAVFEAYRGRSLFDSYEMLEPRVQASGDIAVLSYILARHLAGAETRWNATVVYRRGPEGWRILHSHFSATRSAAQ